MKPYGWNPAVPLTKARQGDRVRLKYNHGRMTVHGRHRDAKIGRMRRLLHRRARQEAKMQIREEGTCKA